VEKDCCRFQRLPRSRSGSGCGIGAGAAERSLAGAGLGMAKEMGLGLELRCGVLRGLHRLKVRKGQLDQWKRLDVADC